MAHSTLRIQTQVDVSALDRLTTAQNAAKDAAAAHKVALQQLAEASAIADSAIGQSASAQAMLADAQAQVAATAQAAAAADAELAAASRTVTAATTEQAVATEAASKATGQMGGMQAYAVGRIAAMGAGLEREGYLFGLMAREMPGIANAMSVIFPIAMAATFAYALGVVAANVDKWYQNTIELKQATADLIQLNESLHNQQEAELDKMTGLASIVGAFGDLSPIHLKLKIPQKDLDDLEKAGFDVRTLINVLQRVGTVADAGQQIQNISSAISQVTDRIASLQAMLNSSPDFRGMPGASGTLGRLAEMILGRDPKTIQGKITAGKQVLQALNAVQDNIKMQETTDRLEFAGRQADQEARAEKAYEQRLKEIARTYAAATKRFHQEVTLAIHGLKTNASAGVDLDAAKAFVAGIPSVAAGAAPVDQSLVDIQMEAARDHQVRMIALQREYAQQSLALGQITAQQELAIETELADAEYQVKKAEIEREIAEIDPEKASSLEERDRLERDIARLRAELQKLKDERAAQIAAANKPQKTGESALEKESDKAFAGINRGMDQMVQGVMMGTQTMAQAWRRMWADMVISETEHLAQSLMKYVEHQAMMLAVTASGINAKQAIADAGNARAKLSDAKAGAVHVWKAVLHALPFPANVIVAPIAAGAEFAAMMAFETGGIVPRTGPALVHAGEAVLPQKLTQHLTSAAESGSGRGSTIHVHNSVSALDGADAHSVLTRNSSSVAAGLHKEMRRKGLV